MSDDFRHHLRALADAADDNFDEFLIEEGLNLLAAYRSIQSEDVRRAVARLVASISESERQITARRLAR